MTPEERGEQVYELFKRGSDLLEHGDFSAAAISLEQARKLEPEKSSIREALGRAYFRSGRYQDASVEFQAVVEGAGPLDADDLFRVSASGHLGASFRLSSQQSSAAPRR